MDSAVMPRMEGARTIPRCRVFNPLDYPVCLHVPDRLTDVAAWHGHIPFAYALVDILLPWTFVELGVHKGDSYCAFCEAVALQKLRTRCYAVDNWKGDEHSGFYGEDVYLEFRNYHDSRYGGFSQLLRSDFSDAVAAFDDGSIDLLHIDGSHTYKQVKRDFETWLPKISTHGVVLLHDIAVRNEDFGVWKLWKELADTYPSLQFDHSHGLGVLGVGRELPEALRMLFEASAAEKASLQLLFERLGHAVTLRAACRDCLQASSRETLEAKTAELARTRRTIESLGEEINRVRARVSDLTNELEQARKAAGKREQLEVELRRTLEPRNREFAYTQSLLFRSARLLWQLKEFPRFAVANVCRWWRRTRRLPSLIELARLAYKAWQRFKSRDLNLRFDLSLLQPEIDPYDAWLAVNTWTPESRESLKNRLAHAGEQLPKISVIMPVHDPAPEFLSRAIQSVASQLYSNWELCIADDASTDPEVNRLLQTWAERDPRIRTMRREENGGISRATNSAASLATGDFLLFLDHDDELSPDALGEVALYINDHPDTDFLYSDDDKINPDGKRFAPQFKPDWSPELLLSYMFCSHLVVVRKSHFDELGGMRAGFEGSQDYDFALRATERAGHVGHIPLVLYHWRAIPGSTAQSGAAKPGSIDAGRRAVQEAFDRRGIRAIASHPEWAARDKVGIFHHEFPDDGPSVTIIIPTRNRPKYLRACLESLQQTTYRNYRIMIVDNGSDEPETIRYLESCGHPVSRILSPGGVFNFAYINNRAVEQTDSDYVLFLNNDTEVREPKWLSRMMGYAQFAGVGAVGARLIFPDGRIQHAGVIHGLYHGIAGPAFKCSPAWDNGYLSYAKVVRNYSAVTGACMLTSRTLFLSVGGFDEEEFAVAYNDIDYCYRLSDLGYRCVYVPGAELIHHEGVSRGSLDEPAEEATFRSKYAGRQDPFYSPHLSLANERFEIMPRRIVRGSNHRPVRAFMTAFNLNREGAAYSQFEMTVQLKDYGVIDPIVYSPEDGPLRDLYEQAGIQVQISLHPLAGVFTATEYESAIDRFAKAIRLTGAEIVYANTLQTFYAVGAAHKAGIPSVWNPRESEPWQTYFDQFGSELARRALGCFAYPYRIIFVADATRDVYSALNSHHNFTVIHNGLNLRRLEKQAGRWTRTTAREKLQAKEEEIILLLLGTVCPRKGQEDLVRALTKLDSRLHRLVQCFIVGDRQSAYSNELHALARSLPESLRPRVHIVPEVEDTALYYRAADIFVCASRIESFPRVVLEAMAYELPIITTPVYGIREQVRPGINGLFYDPGNENQLAKAIAGLINDPERRKQLSVNSRQVLATLNSFEEMVAQYGQTFREAAQSTVCRSAAP